MPEKTFKVCTVKEIDGKDEGVIRFTLTKRIVDRDSEVVEPKGVKIDNFKTNPVVLWAHQSGGFLREAIPPIGKVLIDTMEINDEYVDADVEFDLEDPFAKMIYMKYKNKFLNAGSVGFMPLAWDKEPVLPGQKGYTITKWELFEFSMVPVPANPAALAKSFTKEELKNEKAQQWYEALKDFMGNDHFDHTPEGWVDMKNMVENDRFPTETIEDLLNPGELEIAPPMKNYPENNVKDWIEDVLIQMNNTGVVPHRAFVKAEEHTSFNYLQAAERVREWASTDGSGDEDKMDWSKFRRAFAWFDPSNPKKFNSYKLLHHDVDKDSGELITVWRGVAESMILFLGAKQRNVNIPDHEKSAVYNHLARHYAEFEKNAPDLRSYEEEEIADMQPVSDEDLDLIAKEVIRQMKENNLI